MNEIPKAWLRANRMVLGVDSSMSMSRMMLACWLMAFVDTGVAAGSQIGSLHLVFARRDMPLQSKAKGFSQDHMQK